MALTRPLGAARLAIRSLPRPARSVLSCARRRAEDRCALRAASAAGAVATCERRERLEPSRVPSVRITAGLSSSWACRVQRACARLPIRQEAGGDVPLPRAVAREPRPALTRGSVKVATRCRQRRSSMTGSRSLNMRLTLNGGRRPGSAKSPRMPCPDRRTTPSQLRSRCPTMTVSRFVTCQGSRSSLARHDTDGPWAARHSRPRHRRHPPSRHASRRRGCLLAPWGATATGKAPAPRGLFFMSEFD